MVKKQSADIRLAIADIQKMVYVVREHRAILDFDLARLYGTDFRVESSGST
jgi:hypothetical protein